LEPAEVVAVPAVGAWPPDLQAWEQYFGRLRANDSCSRADLWKARLHLSIYSWAARGSITTASVRQQEAIVEKVLSHGEEVFDGIEADIEEAISGAVDRDNQRFLLTMALSWEVGKHWDGRITIFPGMGPRRASGSLAAWTWRTLIRPWLPKDRRRLDAPYRPEDANIWAGGLCWVLAATGNADSIGEALPEVLRPYAPVSRKGRLVETGEEPDQACLRRFAQDLARVAGGHLVLGREPPPSDIGEVVRRPLRPDNPYRNDPEVRKALHRAYVRLGGGEESTGREAVLEQLAVLLAARWAFLWPPVIRRDPERREYRRVLKAETNRLRRELNLRGVPRQRAR
jgi:hypothetical protein